MTGEKILDLLENVDEELITGSQWGKTVYYPASHRGSRKKKGIVFLLVAVLIMGMAIAAVAGNNSDVNVALRHFMGLDSEAALQLEDGTVKWAVNVSCNGVDCLQNDRGVQKTVTFTSAESIGDDRAVFVRLDTDYEVPEDFNEDTDYFLPEDYRITLENTTWRKLSGEAREYSSVLTCGAEDGKLYFLVSIEDVNNMNSANVDIMIENLMLYHDLGVEDDSAVTEPKQLAFAGSWELHWKYSYRSNSRTYRLHKFITNGKKPFVVTKAEISPLGIRVDGRVPGNRFDDDIVIHITGITLKDGTRIDLGDSNSVGHGREWYFVKLHGYNSTVQDGMILNPSNVYSITINGEEIELHSLKNT